MPRKVSPFFLFIFFILLFSTAIRIYWGFLIPPWQGPDEPTHYEFVHYLYQQYEHPPAQQWDQVELQRYIIHSMSRHRTWIYIDDFAPYSREHFLGHYSQIDNSPPLYYSLNAAFLRLFSPENVEEGLIYSRLFNIFLGMVQLVILIYFSRKYLFHKDSQAWPFYMLWILLLPQFIFLNSVVNSDNLALLIHFLFLWAAFSYHKQPDIKKILGMIILAVAGMLTKRYLYFMPLFIPVTLIITHKPRYSRLFWAGGMILGVILSVFFLFFFFSTGAVREIREIGHIIEYISGGRSLPLRDFYPFLETLMSSYFFRAGWMNIHLPARIHFALIIFVIINCFWFCRYYHDKNKSLILAFTFFYLFLIFVSDFLNPYRGPQGRYLFPVLPLFHFILFQGILSRFSEIREKYFHWSTAFWVLFFLSSSATIWYHYYFKYTFLE